MPRSRSSTRLHGLALAAAGCLAVAAASAATIEYEAEDARLRGVAVVAHDRAGGGARVRYFDAAGDSIEFSIRQPGRFVRLWYSLDGRRERCCTLRSDAAPAMTIWFRPTGGWGRYSSVILPLKVKARLSVVLTEDDVRANAGKSSASIDRVEIGDAPPPELADMGVVRDRVLADIMATDISGVAGFMRSLRPNGTWPDLTYKRFPGIAHLQRLLAMAVALRTPGQALYGNPELKQAVLRGFDWWLSHDPKHWNWWVNDVPVPPLIGGIGLLLPSSLTPEQLMRADVPMFRGWPPPRGGTGVGANLFYRLNGAVRLALIKQDAGMLASIFARAAAEIRITTGEGLQEDFSFLQHGAQFYAGSYGLEFTRYGAMIARLGHDTVFALPPKKRDLLSSFILECQQWIACGDMFDPGAMGRAISRSGFSTAARGLIAPCRTLAGLGWPRAAEFEALADRLEKGPAAAPELSGNRMFWRADFMVHRRPDYYFSIKMVSQRTIGSESGNGEGLKNYHLPDGTTMIMRRGDEYKNIQPLWNWRRLPGITCEQREGAYPSINWGSHMRGKTLFAGGVSTGKIGVAGFEYDKGPVKARKAWFCFDRTMVCLGAGIQGRGDHPVWTTVNQCLRQGSILVGKAGKGGTPFAGGERVLDQPGWILHEGVLRNGTTGKTGLEKEKKYHGNRGDTGIAIGSGRTL